MSDIAPGSCTGLHLARQAAERDGPPPPSQVQARLAMGNFVSPLPAKVHDAIQKTYALCDLILELDPLQMDEPPVVRTAFGDLPIVKTERCQLLEALADRPKDATARGLLRAAAQFEEHCVWIHTAWDARRRRLWEVVYEAELDASEHLFRYLMANLATVAEERARYQRRDPALEIELWMATVLAHVARTRCQVDDLKTTSVVIDAIAIAVTLGAVLGSVGRGDLLLDKKARAEMTAASAMQSEAGRQLAEGVTEYLRVVRTQAERFPVLLILDHADRFDMPADARDAALEALDDAEESIRDLCRAGVHARAVSETRSLSVTALAEDMAEAPRVSVWKLPFFVDRALMGMPPRDANLVRAMRRAAAAKERGTAITQAIALGGVDVAMMAAPLAGPVGVGAAFLWAVVTLGRSVHEYAQLSDLYAASIDPSLLLLGDKHGPASQVGIVFDILGLWV